MEVGFFEASGEALAELGRAFGQQRGGMLKLFGFSAVSRQNRVEVASVVSIELALDEHLWIHARFLWPPPAACKRWRITTEMRSVELTQWRTEKS